MDESLKTEIIESTKEDFPDLSEERITNLLEIILLEIESYNTCKNDISWEKLKSVISEVLYKIIKNESEKTVSSVRRGDTTIICNLKEDNSLSINIILLSLTYIFKIGLPLFQLVV